MCVFCTLRVEGCAEVHLSVPAAPVGGVVHQAGLCNVAWVARGGFGQADWSPWALACSSVFGRGPLKNHLLRGHTHRARSLWGDGALLQARPPDLERLWDRSPQPVEVKAFCFILEPRLRGILSRRASACMLFTCTSGKVCLQSLPLLEFGTTNPNRPWPKRSMSVSDGGLDIYSAWVRRSGHTVRRWKELQTQSSVFSYCTTVAVL